MEIIAYILGWLVLFWGGCLLLLAIWKRELFRSTFSEPYLLGANVLIESDDWGPGGDFHRERFEDVMRLLEQHVDDHGRPATFTADMIMSAPDFGSMREDGFKQYRRTYLDEAFPTLARTFRTWADKGVLVPQFHGLEHCNGDGLCALAREEDERIQEHALDATQPWWDWEELESPFQGHYVDGTHLPSKPVDAATQAFLVREGLSRFASVFGFQPTSAVAPCYLWNDDTEQEWSKGGIRYIQTAGYRCTGRDAQGTYFQDKPWLTFGSRNGLGQMYLVRNTMFEPTDGRGVQGALEEARAAYVQGLPIVISTHRYNFTRSEDAHRDSLRQFAQLLNGLRELGALRYLSSPELGAWVDTPDAPLVHPATGAVWPPLNARSGIAKVSAFLLRLWYRHPKLRVVACVTGLIVPGFLLISATRRNG